MHQKFLSATPKRYKIETHDLEHQAGGLTNWQQEYDQLTNGQFFGRIEKVETAGVHFFKEYTSHGLHQDCQIWQDAIWFGLPFPNQQQARINGSFITENSLACHNGNSSFELITPEDFSIFGVVLEKNVLQSLSQQQGIHFLDSVPLSCDHIQITDEQNRLLQNILRRFINQQEGVVHARIRQDFILNALINGLPSSEKSQHFAVPPSYAHRKKVVDRVREYLHHCRDDMPLSMSDLCEIGCVSRRTLQYSFESILGTSPLKFLRAMRLNQVRRRLKNAAPHETIADIAAYWGFWHAGQFSKDYKALFGESPSQTLAKNQSLNR